MQTETRTLLRGSRLTQWEALLRQSGLTPDMDFDSTTLLWEGDRLVAAGSRKKNLLKCIAVEESRRGDGLTGALLTALRQEAFAVGFPHLFLYTKPENRLLFEGLFFFPVAKTKQVLLMENRRGGIREHLAAQPAVKTAGEIGAIVMNCDPFTLGHLHLLRTAAEECSHVYVFILSEDGGLFSPDARLEMARLAASEFDNVTVLPTGSYLISAATFPTYFLKDRDNADTVHCQLDIEIFLGYYVPHFHITRRYVGTEPLSPLTCRYNEALKARLPAAGITLREIPRFTISGTPVSAGAVRKRMLAGLSADALLPPSTQAYLTQHNLPAKEVTPCSTVSKATF